MSGMDQDRASSTASMQAAAASGAFALASIYYLASTPVESVRYDPASNSVTAKVRLGAGASMAVGRKGDDTSRIGLRPATVWQLVLSYLCRQTRQYR